MQSDVNWRAPARLCCRVGFIAQNAIEVGRGDLAEVISLAMKQPASWRDRLFVSFDADDRELAWPDMTELADRADFPFFI